MIFIAGYYYHFTLEKVAHCYKVYQKYYFNVMSGTDMFGQWPGCLGHEELGND